VSFIWCFGYLAFFRTAAYFGLPQVLPHSNAVQLFLTLRVSVILLNIYSTNIYRPPMKVTIVRITTGVMSLSPSTWRSSLPGKKRVNTVKILGVNLSDDFSVKYHGFGVI